MLKVSLSSMPFTHVMVFDEGMIDCCVCPVAYSMNVVELTLFLALGGHTHASLSTRAFKSKVEEASTLEASECNSKRGKFGY